ncbi:MAG TPA: hypothetical protein VH351_19195 [Bryobacteraceae bacterium]|jgi:hypothetical protein|nr:hypothetical protein [Bryobacteraceae bacterium]
MPRLKDVPPRFASTAREIVDPLHTRVSSNCRRTVFPYGFPVHIRSNSRLVLEAAELSWGTYRQQFSLPALDVRCFVSDTESPACVEPPQFRSQAHLLSIVADHENFACLDLEQGFSFGWVTRNTARSTEYFRQCFLDVMIYPLLEIEYLITLHAACVMFNRKGVLLAGPSGAGKSSLAYACARSGWTYVSDDASAFFRRAAIPEVIGHPHRFRFREPVAELFPEFSDRTSSLRAYGKPTIEVQTATLSGLQTASGSSIDCIIFLNRYEAPSGPPRLRQLSAEEAWKRLLPSVWAVQLPALQERLDALQKLLDLPIYEMQYLEFPPAIDMLKDLTKTL